jgi:hypothetical protein
MAVPTPPTAGEPIAEAWGDVVHDAVVAMDIQQGYADISATSATVAGLAVTFPRAFAAGSVPSVITSIGGASSGTAGGNPWAPGHYGASPTGFTIRASVATAQSVTNLRIHWIAYGPRA